MIKYDARTWSRGNPIEAVEVEKETDNYVWIKGKRSLKIHIRKGVGEDRIFDSFKEARSFLELHYINKIDRMTDDLRREKLILRQIKGSKKPEVRD